MTEHTTEEQTEASGSTAANMKPDEHDLSNQPSQGNVDVAKRVMESCLKQGLVELCKEKPSDPVRWLAHWLLENNPNQPKVIASMDTNG